jgi:hypothetical protein
MCRPPPQRPTLRCPYLIRSHRFFLRPKQERARRLLNGAANTTFCDLDGLAAGQK